MSFYKIMICLAATITSTINIHAMNSQQEKFLYDYATFKHVQTIAADIKAILQKFDTGHDVSGYGINHLKNHSASGIFWVEMKYGACITYSLQTPWGEYTIASLHGKFRKNKKTKEIYRNFEPFDLFYDNEIQIYFYTSFFKDGKNSLQEVIVPGKLAAIQKMYPLVFFKGVLLATALEKEENSYIKKEDIEAAWGQLEKKQYDALKEQEKKDQAEVEILLEQK